MVNTLFILSIWFFTVTLYTCIVIIVACWQSDESLRRGTSLWSRLVTLMTSLPAEHAQWRPEALKGYIKQEIDIVITSKHVDGIKVI